MGEPYDLSKKWKTDDGLTLFCFGPSFYPILNFLFLALLLSWELYFVSNFGGQKGWGRSDKAEEKEKKKRDGGTSDRLTAKEEGGGRGRRE